MLSEGGFPDPSVEESFSSTYPPREQKAAFATVKLIMFFNMLMNVFDRENSRLPETR